MKRSPIRRKSKSSIRKVQDLLWEECRRITKKRYGPTCYTCGKTNLSGSNYQIGHMWPKASVGAYLKYDLRILRPQDFHCNINLGGNGALYYAKMLKEIGEDAMRKLEQDRNIIVKAQDHYEKLLEEYKNL